MSEKLIAELGCIVRQMIDAGVPGWLARMAAKAAYRYESVYDLMVLWQERTDPSDRNNIINDIGEMVYICNNPYPVHGSWSDEKAAAQENKKALQKISSEATSKCMAKHISEILFK